MSSYGPDPFEAGQRDALRATDALLDRVGSRTPTPEDLDDPLVAALALMAAEIDLDAVPVELTRAAVERDLAEVDVAPAPRPIAPADAVVDDRTGLVLDLRDVPASQRDLEAHERTRSLPRVGASKRESDELRHPRHPRRPGRGTRPPATSAIAPPRSLPPSRPIGARPEGRRERRLTPGTAFVAVVAALVLGIGVSAAVTGGRSVNPLTGLHQVVAQLTGGRTVEQSELFDRAQTDLDAASGAAARGDKAGARAHLSDFDALHLGSLTQEDQTSLAKRRAAIEAQLDR